MRGRRASAAAAHRAPGWTPPTAPRRRSDPRRALPAAARNPAGTPKTASSGKMDSSPPRGARGCSVPPLARPRAGHRVPRARARRRGRRPREIPAGTPRRDRPLSAGTPLSCRLLFAPSLQRANCALAVARVPAFLARVAKAGQRVRPAPGTKERRAVVRRAPLRPVSAGGFLWRTPGRVARPRAAGARRRAGARRVPLRRARWAE